MTTAQRGKRALLIGIDAYPKLNRLEGCVADVRLMRSILASTFSFPEDAIAMLINEEATRASILEKLDALVTQTEPDDIVMIHYAGHGSQMTDREGDEPSGLDSTIMPYDSEGWQGDNRDITDDEIHLRLQKLGEKTSFITMVVDACHSGTITRDSFGVKSRGMPADTRPVSQLPPSPLPVAKARGTVESGPSGWMPLADRYVLMAGCRDEEISYEYRPPEAEGKVTHGALTYFLCQELIRAVPGASYRDVFERAAANVTAANNRQHPQLEGQADREIMGVRDLLPMRFVAVTKRVGGVVSLLAGAAHGLTVGSKWKVYPQGTKQVEAERPLGTVEIVSVRGVSSDARVADEVQPNAITAGARCVESEHAWGNLRLRIKVAPPTPGVATPPELVSALGRSALLEVVDDASRAALCIYQIAPRTSAGPSDPVPQLGAVSEPVLAVVGEDGELAMPPRRLQETQQVIENLEKLAKYRQALALENPDPNSKLRGQFDLELLRFSTDGSWKVAEPELAGGSVVFHEGDRIAFRVINRHTEPAFVTLLDFGISGAVSLIHPAPGAKEKMRPDGQFEIGTRESFTLELPKGFPFAEDPTRKAPVAGTEVVKLFVTTSEADFGFLEQASVRSAGPTSPLAQLWRTAASGTATREIVRTPLATDDWTTVVKEFVVRRKAGP